MQKQNNKNNMGKKQGLIDYKNISLFINILFTYRIHICRNYRIYKHEVSSLEKFLESERAWEGVRGYEWSRAFWAPSLKLWLWIGGWRSKMNKDTEGAKRTTPPCALSDGHTPIYFQYPTTWVFCFSPLL